MARYDRVPHPFKLGLRFLCGEHVYEVTRMTDKRAYVQRLDTPPLLHVAVAGFGAGVKIDGYEHGKQGLYVEFSDWQEYKQHAFVEVPRECDPSKTIFKVNLLTKSYLEHINKLADQIDAEKEAVKHLVRDEMRKGVPK